MAAEVKQELERGSEFTLSVASLKKAEEIENLAKKLHDRMKADNALAPKTPLIYEGGPHSAAVVPLRGDAAQLDCRSIYCDRGVMQ